MSEPSRLRLSLDLLRLAWGNLLRRPLRSALTVVGIGIGMTAVVGLLGLTGGLERVLEAQFQRLGHDLVLILPGVGRGLSPAETIEIDWQGLRSVPGVAQLGALLRQTLAVATKEKDSQGFLVIVGLSPETMDYGDRFFSRFELAEGRLPTAGSHEVLLTQGAARALNLHVGEIVRIAEREFLVSGVLQPTGDPQMEGAIVLPLEEMWALTGRVNSASLVWVQARSGYDVEMLAASLEAALRASSMAGSFTVQTSKRLNDIVQMVLGVLRAALTAIAAVALLVGGIGLMNTMYMAVLERTREIGVLVSLGAHESQILTLFLMEAGFLGLLGGIVGVILGMGLAMTMATLIAQAARAPGFAPEASASLIGFALLFSMGLAMLAGVLPARRAASLRPVDALRYE